MASSQLELHNTESNNISADHLSLNNIRSRFNVESILLIDSKKLKFLDTHFKAKTICILKIGLDVYDATQ